jgi:hypothetical protein
LNAALPSDQVSSEQIEDTLTILSELGIEVIENKGNEEPDQRTPGDPRDKTGCATSKVASPLADRRLPPALEPRRRRYGQ